MPTRSPVLACKASFLYTLTYVAASTFDGDLEHIEIYLKNLNIPIQYLSNSSSVTDIKSNNIFLCWGSVNFQCGFNGVFRMRFSDV